MSMKIAIYDLDKTYVQRLSEWMLKHNYKIQMQLCSELSQLSDNMYDMVLIAECMVINPADIRKDIAVAYLSGEKKSDINGNPVVYKYEKGSDLAESIIVSAQQFKENQKLLISQRKENFKTYCVISANEGAGSSTVAASFVKYEQKNNKNVIYINLKMLGKINEYIAGCQVMGAGEILEAADTDDISKVNEMISKTQYYDFSLNPLESRNIISGSIKQLAEIIKNTGLYDELVIATDYDFSDTLKQLFDQSDSIVTVLENNEYSIEKLYKKEAVLKAMDIYNEYKEKSVFIFNKFAGEDNIVLDNEQYRVIGALQKSEGLDKVHLIDKFSQMAVFNSLN